MNRNTSILTVSIGLVAVATGGWLFTHRSSEGEVMYKTAAVERRDLQQTVSATGTVQPFTTVDIKSRAGGEVKELAVDVGTRVKAGDLIARIDPTDSQTTFTEAAADVSAAQARVAQSQQTMSLQKATSVTSINGAKSSVSAAQAGVRAAQARLDQAKAQALAQPALTNAAIQQAKASLQTAEQQYNQMKQATDPQARMDASTALASAQANLKNAEQTLKRQMELSGKGFVSQATVDSAQAERDVARAQMEAARTRTDTIDQNQSAALAASQARVTEAREALHTAEANRVQIRLRQQDVVSAQAALGQAQATLGQAQATYATAQANLAQVGIRASDIDQARAQAVRSEASMNNAKVVLGLTTIRAPRAGVILQKYVEQGTIITSGQSLNSPGTSIVQLGDLSRILVMAQIDESDIAQVRAGQKVKLTLDAFPDHEFEGRVRRTDPLGTTDQNITTVKAQIEIVKLDPNLRPGLNAECEFLVREKKDVLVVPPRAIKKDKGQKTVQVMVGKKPETRTVKTGMETDGGVEITEGLKEGEQVVTAIVKPGDDTGKDKKGGGPKGGSAKGGQNGGARGPGGLGGGGGRGF